MVEVVKATRGPLIELHSVVRHVHGNEVSIWVAGEMLIGSQEVVYARELKLNTLQVLCLTVEKGGKQRRFVVDKWVYRKGELDNYASIHIWDETGNADAPPGYAYNPDNGSVWLDFIAVGE